MALGAALLLGGSPSPSAQGPGAWPHGDPLEFWQSSGADVAGRLGLEPLDGERAMDAMVLELVEELDELQAVDLLLRHDGLKTEVHWGPRCFAHPELGVALDRRLRSAPAATASSPERREALRFVLAHQLAHTLQFRNYSLPSLAAPRHRTASEAQADLLAGVLLAQNRAFAFASREGAKADIERGVQLSTQLAHPPWRRETLLGPGSRARLAQLGFQAGVYYAALWACRTTVDEPGNRRHYREAVRTLERHRKENPALPEFDPETCESEDVFDWTHRMAMGAAAA